MPPAADACAEWDEVMGAMARADSNTCDPSAVAATPIAEPRSRSRSTEPRREMTDSQQEAAMEQ
eukprot:8871202-Alexandrium_andersonii.AAC.1